MKILNLFILVASLAVVAGCQSNQTGTISRASPTTQITESAAPQQNAPPSLVQQEPGPTTIQQITTDKATYTVQSIPSTRLTPTSREGDEANRIYSSNIIAVYVQTNGVTVNSTNARVIPAPTENPQPQNK